MFTIYINSKMKRNTLILLFNIITFILAAQTQKMLYDTTPYAMDYHNQRLAIFKKEPIVKGKIVFLGNSITEFGNWKKWLNDTTVVSRGIAGDNTFGVLDRLQDVIDRQPAKLFLKIGINDIAKNIPDKIIVANILNITQRVKMGSPTTQIFVHSILPTHDSVKIEYPDAYNKNEHVIYINNQLKKKAKEMGFIFVDIYKILSDNNGKLTAKYAESDGLHLNTEGYQLWINLLEKQGYLPKTKAFAQKSNVFSLFDLQLQGKLQVVNRDIKSITQGDKNFIQLSENKGEGLVWLPIETFKNGTIEIEMRGQDVLQKSFVGIAFHALNDSTFDAVYCRPFNFFAQDSVRRIHAIQYISHPVFTWKKLREERNAQYEKEIINPPHPDGWFKMRLVIDDKTIKAFINQKEKPSLVVRKLTDRNTGKLGIFVGDGAGGDFRNIVVKEIKK
jgi:lysophospholipase L1-like esterase